MKNFDVVIVGGGLAGNLLARQLRFQTPDASVLVLEKTPAGGGFKVGESTVEIAANYLSRRQRLGKYLYHRQLPKNSLRFFFDNEDKNAALEDMSEIGSWHLPKVPSFQLDRQRLEEDLTVMNRESGIDLEMGATVKQITLSQDGGHHTVDYVGVDGPKSVSARWVVDAAGRASLVSKMLELRKPTPEHKICSVWGRFEGVLDLDADTGEQFRREARYTPRSLSTNHFCYPGYWIWFIPLASGVTSVGAVIESNRVDKDFFTEQGFLSFLNKHRASADLLKKATLLDMASYAQLSFRTTKFWDGRAKWACVGDAAAFTDPFYSPGSDFIAIENDCVADLIHRDLAGEDVGIRADKYDQFLQFRFESTLKLYAGLYPMFGSYEVFREKGWFDTANYYNVWLDAYLKDEHLDLAAIDYHLSFKNEAIGLMDRFAKMFRQTADTLSSRGEYYRGNLGHRVLTGEESFGVFDEVGSRRSRTSVLKRSEAIFNKTRNNLLAITEQRGPVMSKVATRVDQATLSLTVDQFVGPKDWSQQALT